MSDITRSDCLKFVCFDLSQNNIICGVFFVQCPAMYRLDMLKGIRE